MPFKSKAQQRYMFAAESRGELATGTARRWAHETPSIKALPNKVKKKKKTASVASVVLTGLFQLKRAAAMPTMLKGMPGANPAANVNVQPAGGPGMGGSATAEGVQSLMAGQQQQMQPQQPQQPQQPGQQQPGQMPMPQWQPNPQGQMMYPPGEGPITSQVPKMAAAIRQLVRLKAALDIDPASPMRTSATLEGGFKDVKYNSWQANGEEAWKRVPKRDKSSCAPGPSLWDIISKTL